ncbi:MAG: sugar metabolism transcriptional regulator [Leptolyngbyaceae cyanobacterium CRU_2_3]|nr:sugar metabolism transcriptional regulator [Leptolyngbyaceae cyanobacterium CRU_2_3]
MILSELQTYLADRQRVSLADLQIHFRMDAEPLRDMLNRLIRKGRVQREAASKCGGCHSCSSEAIEFYEWIKERQVQS